MRDSFDMADCTVDFTVERSLGQELEQKFVESCAFVLPNMRIKKAKLIIVNLQKNEAIVA